MIKTHIHTYTHKICCHKKERRKKYFNCFYILLHNFLVFSFFENILSRQSKQTKKNFAVKKVKWKTKRNFKKPEENYMDKAANIINVIHTMAILKTEI